MDFDSVETLNENEILESFYDNYLESAIYTSDMWCTACSLQMDNGGGQIGGGNNGGGCWHSRQIILERQCRHVISYTPYTFSSSNSCGSLTYVCPGGIE